MTSESMRAPSRHPPHVGAAVNPARAPDERTITPMGAFTIADVMLTIRPKLRATMPSRTSRIMSARASKLASSAACYESRSQWS